MNIPHLMGPSGALPYAVGFVAQYLQLQKKIGVSTWKPVSASWVFHPRAGLHRAVGFDPRACRLSNPRAATLPARPSSLGVH